MLTVDQDELLASEAPPACALLLHCICTQQRFGPARLLFIHSDIDLLNIACNITCGDVTLSCALRECQRFGFSSSLRLQHLFFFFLTLS